MNPDFRRGLSNAFMTDLRKGTTAPMLDACRAKGLDVRLRAEYLNAYSAGRAVMKLMKQRSGTTLQVHHKYLHAQAFKAAPRRTQGDYVLLSVTPALAAQFAGELDRIIEASHKHRHVEELSEERLLLDNAGGGPFQAIDRQVGVPGTRSYVDVVGVLEGRRPSLVLVELKRDLDNRIQEVAVQVARYLEIFSPEGKGLRPDIAKSLRLVASQLKELGFAAPAAAAFEPGMPVLGLVALVRYNPKSELLGRAHASAATLQQPVWLWSALDETRLQIPAQAQWTRMGNAPP